MVRLCIYLIPLIVISTACNKNHADNSDSPAFIYYNTVEFTASEVNYTNTDSGLLITCYKNSNSNAPYGYGVIKSLNIFLRSYSGVNNYDISGCDEFLYEFQSRGTTDRTCAITGFVNISTDDDKNLIGNFELDQLSITRDTIRTGGMFNITK